MAGHFNQLFMVLLISISAAVATNQLQVQSRQMVARAQISSDESSIEGIGGRRELEQDKLKCYNGAVVKGSGSKAKCTCAGPANYNTKTKKCVCPSSKQIWSSSLKRCITKKSPPPPPKKKSPPPPPPKKKRSPRAGR